MRRRNVNGLIVLILLVVSLPALLIAGYGAWRKWFRREPLLAVDTVAVMTLNNTGVGHMEQFNYAKAASVFEEIVALAPDWTPGKINLGIALLNQGDGPTQDRANLRRAESLFLEVLEREADNPYAHHCLGLIYNYEGKFE